MKLIFSVLFLSFNLAAFAQQPPEAAAPALPSQAAVPSVPALPSQAALPAKAALVSPSSAEPSAAELYTSGQYLKAAQKYEAQISLEPKNPYVYYNLANSYFKAGDPDKAIINYYRAFRLLPRDKDIKANLSFVLGATGQIFRDENIPGVIFNLYYLFSSSELRGISLALGWVVAIAFAVWMFGCKKSFSRKMFFYTLGLAVFFGLWYFIRLPYDTDRLAITTAPRAEVRSGPGENFPVSVSIPKAHLVSITDTKGSWSQVKVKAENAEGWVLSKSIEEI